MPPQTAITAAPLRVLFCTNNFLEPHHHAIQALLRTTPGVDFAVGAKRFYSNDLTRRVATVDRFVLGDQIKLAAQLEQADVFHCTIDSDLTIDAARTAIGMGVPVVVSFLGGFDMSAKLKRPEALDQLRPVLTAAAAITVAVPSAVKWMERLVGRPFEYLPVPVWPVFPRDPQPPREPGLLVTCGRFIERKGIDQAIYAMPHMPRARLVIVGDGPLRSELEELAMKHGVARRVQFAGALPLPETLSLIRRAAVLLHLSRVGPEGDFEGVPQTILWAQWLGTPVVATDVGGIGEIVAHRSSGIITAPDPASVAEAVDLTRLHAGDLAKTARTLVAAGHGLARVARQLETTYRRVVAAPRRLDATPAPLLDLPIRELLRQIEPAATIASIRHTNNHAIAEIQSPRFGQCALKLRQGRTAGAHLPAREVVALERLADADWAPRLFAFDLVAGWILRSWASGRSLDFYQTDKLELTDLSQFAAFGRAVIERFREDPLGVVVKDFKPANIVYDGTRFMFVDFDSVSRLEDLRAERSPLLLGTGKHRHFAPELLAREQARIGPALDFFAFGTTFFHVMQGFVPWTNLERSPAQARERYAFEFQRLQSVYAATLQQRGIRTEWQSFLIGCLNPAPEHRPKGFPTAYFV
jgi:glycosyltransferase involved in cell wall biosynthesis